MLIKIFSFIFYITVICPLAFWYKIIGRDVLRLRLDKDAKTYWENYE